jgi:hypothetical protein
MAPPRLRPAARMVAGGRNTAHRVLLRHYLLAWASVHLTVFGRIYLKGVKFRPGYIDRLPLRLVPRELVEAPPANAAGLMSATRHLFRRQRPSQL